jgi:hypothetical protein
VGTPEERDQQEDLDADGRIILRWVLEWADIDWADLAQDRGHWTAFVNAVMKLQVT